MEDTLSYFKKIKSSEKIKKLAKKYQGKKVVIYGAGEYFSILYNNFDFSGLNIVGISDKKFEVSKNENPSEYIPLCPDELKDFDYDVILILLKDDEKMCDYLEYQLLVNTKNENKIIVPFFGKNLNKENAKKYYLNERRLFYFIESIADKNDLAKISNDLELILNEIKQNKNKYLLKPSKRYKMLYKYYKKMVDLMFANLDIKKLKPAPEEKYRKFQLKTLDFCKRITDFLDKNGIEYFISSGTLIGAMRHKGFVPWDDDFDVGVLRKDYEKLKQILKDNFIEIDNSKVCISKNNRLKIINNALKKSKGKILFFHGIQYIQIYQGSSIYDCVSIDIFSHDYYRDDYTWEKHREYLKQIREKRKELDYFSKIIEYLDEERKNNPDIVEKSNTIYYGIDNLGGYIVTPTSFMTQDTIYPRRKMVFEGYEFYAPHSPEGYTEVQYKDFMSFPKNIQLGHEGFNR